MKFQLSDKNKTRQTLYDYFVNWQEQRRNRKAFWTSTNEDIERMDFYSQFISKNDIVFDVGANLGNRSRVFSKIGAVVIAVEPQKYCSDYLQAVFKKTTKFTLVKRALGASVGQAEMQICNAHTISSLSQEWIKAVKESGRFSEYEWNQSETVKIDTLDNLIAEYGTPSFIKIDVEGFEEQVLAGLSKPVQAISLEFCPEIIENTLKCIDRLNNIANWQFQICVGEAMKFILPEWVGSQEVINELKKLPADCFGDLYARLNQKESSE